MLDDTSSLAAFTRKICNEGQMEMSKQPHSPRPPFAKPGKQTHFLRACEAGKTLNLVDKTAVHLKA